MSNKTIECLDGDCLENIFRFLPILDRVRVERVCKRWQEAALRSWFFFKRLDLNPTNWYHNTERKTTSKISTPDLYQVLRRCGQYLVEVDLSKKCKSSLLGSGAVTIVAKCCPNVQSINLSGLNISLSALNALLKNSNNLKEFIMTDHTITGSEIKNGAATVLTKLFLKNKVKNVAISSQLISDNILFTKNSSAYIERLVVTKYTNGHRKLDKVIGNMNKLQALKVCLLPTRNQGTPSFLSMIKSPELKELELCVEPDESCFGKALVISKNTNRVSKSLFSITKFDNLIRLNLPNIRRVNDTFLSVAVAYCRKLEFININFCRNVKDQSIVAFSSLSRLRSLECEDCKIHDTSLIQLLNSCPYLGTLNISHCKLITSELVVAAKEAVLNRNNSITLTLSAHKTAILKVSESVPLLKILC